MFRGYLYRTQANVSISVSISGNEARVNDSFRYDMIYFKINNDFDITPLMQKNFINSSRTMSSFSFVRR